VEKVTFILLTFLSSIVEVDRSEYSFVIEVVLRASLLFRFDGAVVQVVRRDVMCNFLKKSFGLLQVAYTQKV
jgi:hypothetical protein